MIGSLSIYDAKRYFPLINVAIYGSSLFLVALALKMILDLALPVAFTAFLLLLLSGLLTAWICSISMCVAALLFSFRWFLKKFKPTYMQNSWASRFAYLGDILLEEYEERSWGMPL